MHPPILVRPVAPNDAEALRTIYNWAVANSTATMETNLRTPEIQAEWMAHHSAPPHVALVASVKSPVSPEEADPAAVVGYASLSPYIPRPGYRYTAETSVYIHPDWHGRGIGTALLAALIEAADTHGIVVLLGLITADNEASLRLHRRFGFQEVGVQRYVGYKFGQWVDVAILERLNEANREAAR